MTNFLKEYRCQHCNKLFFKGDLSHCTIEIKCKNCKEFSTVTGRNCSLYLMMDDKKNKPKPSLSNLKESDIKNAVLQCSECDKKDDCSLHKHLEENICPICKKPVDEKK